MIHGAGMRRVSQIRIATASSTRPATSSEAAIVGRAMTVESEIARAGARPCGTSFAKPPSRTGVWRESRSRSASTINSTSSPNETRRSQPSFSRAFEASPTRWSTSAVGTRGRSSRTARGRARRGRRPLRELPDRVLLPAREDVILGLGLLQHHPHPLDVIPGVAPIALASRFPRRARPRSRA